MTIKVGVVGYGTIGKRVADAVRKQEDMKLVGVTGNSFNYRIKAASESGISIYTVADPKPFRDHGIQPAGSMDDLIKSVDVMVDAAPKKVGAENKKLYAKAGVKAIFQGGEKPEVADVSFVAQCNYGKAVGKNYVRVVSCNTTGLCRTLGAVDTAFGIKKVRACMIRRATDPDDSEKGPINAIIPTLDLPSHHGPDVKTVLPVDIITTSMVVPTTLMHLHSIAVELKKSATPADVISLFGKTTRVRLVSEEEGIESTAQIMELAKELGRRRNDMMEICVWKEGIGFDKNELYYFQAVHQESNVVPENIDAIRAVTGFKDGKKSIEMTNKALGIK